MFWIIAYFAGIATPFAIAGLFWGITTLMLRDHGSLGCHVCNLAEYDTGEKTRLEHYLRTAWHHWVIASRKKHKLAWAAHWANPKNRIR